MIVSCLKEGTSLKEGEVWGVFPSCGQNGKRKRIIMDLVVTYFGIASSCLHSWLVIEQTLWLAYTCKVAIRRDPIHSLFNA